MNQYELCEVLNITEKELKENLNNTNEGKLLIDFVCSFSQFDFELRLNQIKDFKIRKKEKLKLDPIEIDTFIDPNNSSISEVLTIKECIDFIHRNAGNRSIGAATKYYEELVKSEKDEKRIRFIWNGETELKDKASCMRGSLKRITQGKFRGAASNNHRAKFFLID